MLDEVQDHLCAVRIFHPVWITCQVQVIQLIEVGSTKRSDQGCSLLGQGIVTRDIVQIQVLKLIRTGLNDGLCQLEQLLSYGSR